MDQIKSSRTKKSVECNSQIPNILNLVPWLVLIVCKSTFKTLMQPTNLKLQPMFLFAVFLYLGIHPLHQSVPLHQHVCEGGAREDPDNLGAERGQVLQTAGEYFVHCFLISGRHVMASEGKM